MTFDILLYKGIDIRNEKSLEDRIKKLDDVINNCFGNKFIVKINP